MQWERLHPEGWRQRYRSKVISAKGAISKVRNGDKVFLGTGCGEPQHLIRTLLSSKTLLDVDLYQILPFTLAHFLDDPYFTHRFNFHTFFISDRIRRAAFQGKVRYIPAYLSEIPALFDRQIELDVALIQVTPPDEFGFCSLGISVDVTKRAAERAKLLIAQVNAFMPRTLGDTFIPVDKIDYLVPYDEPLIEVEIPQGDEMIQRIGRNVSRLVEDGSTIEIGIGKTPAAVLPYLQHKRDLGVHTEMLSDAYIDLVAEGVITNERKTLHPGKIIASFCMGTRRLYRFVHNNPMIELHPSEYVNNRFVIAQNDRMASINTALEVDLTGQVCSDSLGYLFYSGVGGQADFLRGAAMSKGGVPIIALPSTAKGGQVSRIVPRLSEGAGVVITRAGVHFVVTEYGIGYLRGRDVAQRVLEMVNLAHPRFRKGLLEAAKEKHYIFTDQIPPPEKDLVYLEKLERTFGLKDGRKALIRPIRPTDEFAFRNFIYSFSDESLYNRFFQVIRVWPHPEAQRWVNIDYERTMTLVAVIEEEKEVRRIIGMAQYGEAEPGTVEVALLVHEDFRNQGLGTFMLRLILEIAKEKGYREVSMTLLEDNKAVLHIVKGLFPGIKFERGSGGILKAKAALEGRSVDGC